ncbi:N-6 DNA methylase [Candidatus Halobeggiatoa sp. HSG11]|nr:N-6 DNA methylase [Candidatus Halobeggiatoa sp. HSG11]
MQNITPKHKIIKKYYQDLKSFERINQLQEDTVKQAFQHVLEFYAGQRNWTLIQEQTISSIRLDGTVFDDSKIPRGYWEAKRDSVDLSPAIQEKLYDKGYPKDNIIFQKPSHAILIQNGEEVLDVSLDQPESLIAVVEKFFDYRTPENERWDKAADEFKDVVPLLGEKLLKIIRTALIKDKPFKKAFDSFANQCRQSINPDLADAAIEEMLIQHLLTERIFRKLFDHPDFAKRNIIAREIENVIEKLTAKSFNRDAFFEDLQYFYQALESVAATIRDYSYKQHFLNTIYERFFQGFSVKVADTHGIVYTPQPIVDFMVRSVEEILQKEFGKSLVDRNVHVLDPFVGTGNFITRIIRELANGKKMDLNRKYKKELHCNEIMLLPYYLACMNIEHQYMDSMGRYEPFNGICLADTFKLADEQQADLFAKENTERIKKQKATDFYVIIGNPPYNAWQANENDNNKNQTYNTVGDWVKDTYAKDSKATLKNSLSDPYVKAIKWASNRIKNEGIVAFVSNNGFLDNIAFDGMRKHLEQDFTKIYILDLGGNIRKSHGKTSNVFDIKVGVSINLFVKNDSVKKGIYYAKIDDSLSKEEKLSSLENPVDWQQIIPNDKYTWLTEGLHSEFDDFIPLGTKEAKKQKGITEDVIFKIYSNGVKTNRDVWAYNFNQQMLEQNMQNMIAFYNQQVEQWLNKSDDKLSIDNFVVYNDKQIKWSGDLKIHLKAGRLAKFSNDKIRISLYRPFTHSYLFFNRTMNNRVYVFPSIFPTPETELENKVICVTGNGSEKPFTPFISNIIVDLNMISPGAGGTQCFPFYTYNEDGSNRTENITDWALNHWQQHYQDKKITKWDIFHFVYGLLHQPQYREKYSQNLKRELPRLPMTDNFWQYSKAGKQLADLHLNYETVEPYELELIENPKHPFSLDVEKMRLSKDKTEIIYNKFLTIKGIPAQAHEYKLGNRSALQWIVDQYRIKTDKRSGIINNPNRKDDENYILDLIGKIVTVSLETVEIVEGLKNSNIS